MTRRRAATPCPCGLPASYPACCGRFHRGGSAPTAEALMRSRYSAFVVGDADYLLRTWDPSTRPADLTLDTSVWKRLAVLEVSPTTVSFEAVFVHDGVPGVLRENSAFSRAAGEWFYVGPVE